MTLMADNTFPNNFLETKYAIFMLMAPGAVTGTNLITNYFITKFGQALLNSFDIYQNRPGSKAIIVL